MTSPQIFVTFFVVATAWALPYIFFAKVNNTLEPLYGISLGERFNSVSMFGYGDPSIKPGEFSLDHDYAVATKVIGWQYVGFNNGIFGFGPKIPFTLMKVDIDGRVEAQRFHSCDLMGGPARGIMYGYGPMNPDYCFKVDIYILPYNQETKSVQLSRSLFASGIKVHSDSFKLRCSNHYRGPTAYSDLFEYATNYNGPCDIYINSELIRPTGVVSPTLGTR